MNLPETLYKNRVINEQNPCIKAQHLQLTMSPSILHDFEDKGKGKPHHRLKMGIVSASLWEEAGIGERSWNRTHSQHVCTGKHIRQVPEGKCR